MYSNIISLGDTGLLLVQNCSDHQRIRITEGPLYFQRH